jgi:hypothetical protein
MFEVFCEGAATSMIFMFDGIEVATEDDLRKAEKRTADEQERNKRYVDGLPPEQRAQLEQVLRERATPTPEMRAETERRWAEYRRHTAAHRALAKNASTPAAAAPVPAERGRAPREATNTRLRGSRRKSARSSSSSGDDPPPSPTGRSCKAGCGREIDHRTPGARYCTDEDCGRARAADRQRGVRARDRSDSERAADRGYSRAVKLGVAADRLCDRSCGASPVNVRETPDGDVLCGVCGRWRAAPTASVNGYDETLRDMQQLDERGGGHRRHESWTLPPKPPPLPWPSRTYFDVTVIADPIREGVVVAA